MASLPTWVIAGTHSGSGKTSLTLALTRALARRGVVVQTFKTGPDFLDPTYLSVASGRPCHNLDGWMAGHDGVRRLFARAAADADCALIEGVMGLYDGADPEGDAGSTAEIARLLDAPILLVVNVHGMAGSLAALVKGFTSFAPELRFAGIIANHCGSERHVAWLAAALKAAGLPPLVGAIPRGGFPALASRHLGLVTADGETLPTATLDTLADALEGRLELPGLFPALPARVAHRRPGAATGPAAAPATGRPAATALALATPQDPRQLSLFADGKVGAGAMPAAESPQHRTAGPLRIAVAKDAAFHFYYEALFAALTAAGAELCFFSPLADQRLPEGTSGLYLGGGYPEAHAERLSANGEMLGAIRTYAAQDRPLYAECGGLIYLSRGLLEKDGCFHPFLGILPSRTRLLDRKRSLGYVEVTLLADSLWGSRGETFRGHEFHYSELIDDPAAEPLWRRVYALKRRRSETIEAEGFQRGNLLASYAHLYYAHRVAAVAHFLKTCGDRS